MKDINFSKIVESNGLKAHSQGIFGKCKPFKNDEKFFLFQLKSSFRSQDI